MATNYNTVINEIDDSIFINGLRRYYDERLAAERDMANTFELFLERLVSDPDLCGSREEKRSEIYAIAVLDGIIPIDDVPEELRIQRRTIWIYAFRFARGQYKRNVEGAKELYIHGLELLKRDASEHPSPYKEMLERTYSDYCDVEHQLNVFDLLDPASFKDVDGEIS